MFGYCRHWLPKSFIPVFLLLLVFLATEIVSAGTKELARLHEELGIIANDTYGRPVQLTPKKLKSIGQDIYNRPQRLQPQAADAWLAMVKAAEKDKVSLLLVSAYRSIDYQAELIRRKLNKGKKIEEILRTVAAPGHSEHQSGRAVDVSCFKCPVLEESFEKTKTFAWLVQNAEKYGFTLSYPRNNPGRIIYEPWHWYFQSLKTETAP